MKIYRRLETPKIYANVYEETIDADGVLSVGDLTDPTSSMKIIIEDSTGVVVETLADMDNPSTGKYSYSAYTIPVDAHTGEWNYECRATSGTSVATGRGSFEVKEQVA